MVASTNSTEHIVTPTRVAIDTLSNFLKHKTEPIFTHDILMAGLRANGRITYGESGNNINWPVRYKRREVEDADGYDANVATPRTVVRRRAILPWRRFRLGESLTKFEQLANRGEAQLFNILGNLVGETVDDFLVSYRKKLFDDGNITGSKSLHGFESMFGISGLISANSFVGDPDDNYGGMDTDLGQFGGEWTPDTDGEWPTGSGSTEYQFWSPLVVDATNTNWQATTTTWKNTWQEALRFSMAYLEMNQEMRPDFALLNTRRLLEANRSVESTQRFELTQSSELTRVGFRTLAYEGIELTSQPNVPTGVTYLFPWSKITLRNMLSQLVDVEKDKDPNDSSELFYFDNFSQLVFDSPAFFAKILDIT